jgi:diguanylate cyclase (GGDEF)-like protein
VPSAFARAVKGCLRAYDVVGRYGGEEFLLVAPGTRPPAESGLFERVCRNVAAAPASTDAGAIPFTVGNGIAGVRGKGTAEALLAAADASRYRAKAKGRNRACDAPETASPKTEG